MFKKIMLFIVFAVLLNVGKSQDQKLNIVVIGAHPDDCDIDAGGTAIKFAQMGHHVLFISTTNGDAGHYIKLGEVLADIRKEEAKEAGKRLGITYEVLNNHDGFLMPDLDLRLELIHMIREWKADVVIGPRPYDYHPDHRNTAIAVQDAAYLVIVPYIGRQTTALKKNPVFLYTEDRFKKPIPFSYDIVIDISDVNDKKVFAMAAHKSQFFEWLPWLSGQLANVPKSDEGRLKWLAETRKGSISKEARTGLSKWYGAKADKVKYAESFEICEFGRIPDDKEIRHLFPMLGK